MRLKEELKLLRDYFKHQHFKRHYNNSVKNISKFKNKHLNERCFVIGNGPSLRKTDLEQLKNEYTFGSNKIYELFPSVNWRPTYYVSQDSYVLQNNIENINKISNEYTAGFYPTDFKKFYSEDFINKNNNYFFFFDRTFNVRGYPKFTADCEKKIYNGFTVTYSSIQMAIYMGFKEIYLIGCDHSYSNNDSNKVTEKSYVTGISGPSKGEKYNKPRIDETTIAYEEALRYAERKNIKIFNATRGGKLEVFERRDFDYVFK